MSPTFDCLRAFAAGVAVCCVICGAFAASGERHVGIDNFTFNPGTITIPLGTKVEWENDDDIPHSIVETTGRFHSAALDTDDKFSFIFNQAGTFDYFCGLHPHMIGKIVVIP
jgi:plastocyanin